MGAPMGRGLPSVKFNALNGLSLLALLALTGCDYDGPAPPGPGGEVDGGEGGLDAGGGGEGGAGGVAGEGGGAGGVGGVGGAGGEGGVGGAGGEGGAAPTCEDGIQNGDETGTDCGGACAACPPPPACVEDVDCGGGTCDAGMCTCAEGFMLNEGGRCDDVNECPGQPCPGPQVCTNVPGGFDCACPPGSTPAEGDTCAYRASCRQIKGADPGATDGAYAIDPDGAGPAPASMVHCDMTTDGGAGYTMLTVVNEALVAGEHVQGAYHDACAARGLEIVVPRSRNHMTSLIDYNGGLLNIVGVYPRPAFVRPFSRGLNEYIGRCQGQPCDFWLADSTNASCAEGGFEPNGNNRPDHALIRQAFAVCGSGSWDDNFDAVEIPGFVVCSTNDAGLTPRSCLDALGMDLQINLGGQDIDGPNGTYVLDTDGPDGPLAPYVAWCDQTNWGGGWTLALKTQSDSAFRYDHPVWIHDRPVNHDDSDISQGDAMLASYLHLPVRQVMLRMGDGQVIVDLGQAAPSMQAIMASGFLPTQADVGDWINMVADRQGGLQPHCNAQGFNVDSALRRVRFGILGNNEPNCSSPDSFIGIGHSAEDACGDRGIISGNNAGTRCGGERVSLQLQGLLFVREAMVE